MLRRRGRRRAGWSSWCVLRSLWSWRLTVQEGLSLRRQAGQMSSEALVQRAPRLWRGEEPIKNRRAPAGATAAVQPEEFSGEESSAAQLDAATQTTAQSESGGGTEEGQGAGHDSRRRSRYNNGESQRIIAITTKLIYSWYA